MGCDIYNYTVLRIQHIQNNVNLDEIIILSTEKIYLHGLQYDEEFQCEDFLQNDFSWTLPCLIYQYDKFIDSDYKEKYHLLIQETINENIEFYCDRYPLNYTDDGINFVNNRYLSSMENITNIYIDEIKRWRS